MEIIAVFLDYNLNVEPRSVWKIAPGAAESERYPFLVNECGVFYANPGFYTKRYAKDDYQILYTASGAAQMEYAGKIWRLAEGSIAMIDCNQYHNYRTAQDAAHWTYHWIHVGGCYCAQYYNAIYRKGFEPRHIGPDGELLRDFEEAIDQIDHTTDEACIRLNRAVGSIMTKLIASRDSAPPSAQEAAVSRALSYMQRNLSQPFSMDALSGEINLSKYYLIKLFSRHMGMTPYHYLIQCRINESKKLLRATDHKLSDIAEAVGFQDTSNFSRTFAKIVGTTPAQYRGGRT